MEGGLNGFLEDLIISFSFQDVSLGGAVVEVDAFEIVLNFVKNGLELSIAMEVADVESIAIVES